MTVSSTSRSSAAVPARRLRIATGVLLVLLVAAPTAVGASEPPGAGAEAQPETARLTRSVPRPAGSYLSTHLWVSSRLRRGYLLRSNALAGPKSNGFEQLVAVDLETGAEVASAPLDPVGYANPAADVSAAADASIGADNAMVVDDEGGRLFVATQSPSVTVSGTAQQRAVGKATAASKGELCVRPGGNTLLFGCLNGVTQLDAGTLEPVRHFALRGLSAESPFVAPMLLAMNVSPAAGELGPKLHVLVQESATAAETQGTPGVGASTRAQSLILTSLAQFDVDSGTQDWAVRVDACRGAMSASNANANSELIGMRHQAAILAGRAPQDRAVYVACHMVSQTLQAAVVRVPLTDDGMPGALPVPLPGAPAGAPGPATAGTDLSGGPHPGHSVVVPGPDRVHEMIPDPASGRIAMQVLDGKPLAQVWWVFDTALMRFVGTVGIGGPTAVGATLAAMDHGRLYALAKDFTRNGRSFAGGLFVADIDRTPVAQALVYPELADAFPNGYDAGATRAALSVQRLDGGARRLWLPKEWGAIRLTAYQAIEDHRPTGIPGAADDFAERTLDLAEADGVTDASLDGAARGYGARVLLVGGAESMLRAGPVDPVGTVEQCNDPDWGSYNGGTTTLEGVAPTGRGAGGPCYYAGQPVTSPCGSGNRELVLASVGPERPAIVDDGGARGTASPIVIDSLTGADLDTPLSRCAGQDWDQVWGTALFGRAPLPEPHGDTSPARILAECVSSGGPQQHTAGEPVSGGFSAAVACEEGEASGHAYTRGTSLDGVDVAEAMANFRIYRDPQRGIVSRVESVARGLSIDGVVRIDGVRGVAESWANGRRQPVAAADRPDGYDPGCDFERTAGTCFRRHIVGVHTPVYACGPCGDEAALAAGLSAALAPMNATVQLREPDARLRTGAENGYLAAVQKPEADRFGDLVLNNDLLQTVLPTLEIVRNAAPNRVLTRMGSRGRQIYQFAGVEVSSSYGISCLLVYDPATQTCAPAQESPGSLTVSLADTDGTPLAGGAFELRVDGDGDGLLGLADAMAPGGACLTATDGVGTCRFAALPPGAYLLTQIAAPPGFARVAEPHAVALAAGEARTVAFTNAAEPSGAAPPALPAPPPQAGTAPERPPAPQRGATAAPPMETSGPYTPPPPQDAAHPVLAPLGGTIVRIVRAPGDTLRLLARSPIEAAAWIASIALLLAAFGAVRRRIRTTALIAGEMGSPGESS